MNAPSRTAPKGSAWEHWTTPKHVLDRVRKVGVIELDPCSNEASEVNARGSWRGLKHASCDGLFEPWGLGLVFVNPPYGRALGDWTKKISAEGTAGAEIIALLPASMGPAWMHDNVLASAHAMLLVRGRLKFGNPPPTGSSSSTFDNLIAYWGRRTDAFCDAFEDMGHLSLLNVEIPTPITRAAARS